MCCTAENIVAVLHPFPTVQRKQKHASPYRIGITPEGPAAGQPVRSGRDPGGKTPPKGGVFPPFPDTDAGKHVRTKPDKVSSDGISKQINGLIDCADKPDKAGQALCPGQKQGCRTSRTSPDKKACPAHDITHARSSRTMTAPLATRSSRARRNALVWVSLLSEDDKPPSSKHAARHASTDTHGVPG